MLTVLMSGGLFTRNLLAFIAVARCCAILSEIGGLLPKLWVPHDSQAVPGFFPWRCPSPLGAFLAIGLHLLRPGELPRFHGLHRQQTTL